jgi:hypothetical protein
MHKSINREAIINPQTDRLVEVSDSFAARALGCDAIRSGMVRDYHLCLAPRCGTTVAPVTG